MKCNKMKFKSELNRAKKAYGTKSTSRWCQKCLIFGIAERIVNILREIEPNFNLMVQLGERLETLD